MRAALRNMAEAGSGSVINIGSSWSSRASIFNQDGGGVDYCTAKAGLQALTRAAAHDVAPFGVRVNAIRPGFFPTDWNRKNFITPEREAAILGHTAMKRYGEVDELTGALIWLASDASGFVTGAEIAVDGGYSAMTI